MNPVLRFQRLCFFRNIYLFTGLGVVALYFIIKELENLSTSSNYTNIKKGRNNISSSIFKQDLQEEIRLKLEEEADRAETLTCQIPTLIPNEEEVMKLNHEQFIKSGYIPSCVNNNSTKFKMDYGSKLIRLNANDSFWDFAQCCYVSFWRVHTQPDFNIVSSTMCYNITNDPQVLPKHHAFIRIKCTHKRTNQIIYEDNLGHFSLIQPEMDDDRVEHIPDDATEKLSIVIFGMDSISHMNFQRYMPKAHKYLVDVMEAVKFEGFASLGAGVRQNIFPMLSGLTLSEFRNLCWTFDQNYMNKCPFIWDDLKDYEISFQEDDSNHSMFKDSKSPGFHRIPFDFDLRVLTQGLENITIGHGLNLNNRSQTHKFNECYGSRLSFKYLLDNILLLMDLFKTTAHFHFTWTQSLTRTLNEFAKFGDEPLLSAFQEMVSRQLLNRTALIIMSNQGISYGPLREKTEQGFLEERLPLLYVVLPKWFQRKYRRATRNFKRNSKILTTTLDLHKTFLKLANLNTISNSKLTVSTSLKLNSHHRKRRSPNGTAGIVKRVPTKSNTQEGQHYQMYGLDDDENNNKDSNDFDDDIGLSLFSPISPSRTCESVQINDLFCICLEKMDVAVNESVVMQATSFILSEMNKKLLLFPVCSPLKLNKIQSAHLLKDQKSVVGLPRSRSHRDAAGANAFAGVENPYRSTTIATTNPTKRISGSQSQSKSTSSPPLPPARPDVPIGNGMGIKARKSLRHQIKEPRIFKITFSTLPTGALFEASVKNVQVRIKNHENLFILGEINRIGDYRYSQKCSPTIGVRPYCVC